MSPDSPESLDQLLKQASAALAEAKNAGRDRYCSR
jgi:PleD family two-component response regulator